ncbi:MAG: CHASE2 domain-containing protein [Elusimicrobia bacterium]|nr:CHASE2 domain-containing protein [Elusimicrobiota bacterium]
MPSLLLLGALALRLARVETLQAYQDKIFDAYQALSPRPYRSAPVRVIDIDDESLARLGPWPWPRPLMARLMTRLSELGAAAVALDIVFSEPDRTSPRRLADLMPNLPETAAFREKARLLPDHDALLAQAMARTRAAAGFMLTDRASPAAPALKAGIAYAGDSPLSYLGDFSGAVLNLPELEGAAAGHGFLNFIPEGDGIVRRVPLLLRKGPVVYPSLALEALRLAQGADGLAVKSSGASRVPSFGQHTGINSVKVGALVLPTDAAGRFRPHYSEPSPERTIPAWRLLEPVFPKERVAGAIALVGSSAPRLQDLHATPLHPAAPGVEIQAQIVEQALLGAFLRRPDWADGAEAAYLLALGGLLILLLPRLGAAWCGIWGLTMAAAAFPLSWYAYSRLHWLLDPLFPSLAALAIYTASSLIGRLRDEAERRRLLILDAAKDHFVSTVSHDLRGPVNAMIMVVQAMRAGLYGPLNEKQSQNLLRVETAGWQLVLLISNILDAAKIKAGRMKLHRQEVRPRELVSPVVEIFALVAASRGTALETRVPDDLPPLFADREKLEQVVNNLVSNALKFTPTGGRIIVGAELDGDGVRFRVDDTGRGIAAEDIPKLFQEFQQLDAGLRKELKIAGTGLGLAICRTIIEAHGGRIWVESEKGKGSSFLFTIPARAHGAPTA